MNVENTVSGGGPVSVLPASNTTPTDVLTSNSLAHLLFPRRRLTKLLRSATGRGRTCSTHASTIKYVNYTSRLLCESIGRSDLCAVGSNPRLYLCLADVCSFLYVCTTIGGGA